MTITYPRPKPQVSQRHLSGSRYHHQHHFDFLTVVSINRSEYCIAKAGLARGDYPFSTAQVVMVDGGMTIPRL